jgi:hypothetical protein
VIGCKLGGGGSQRNSFESKSGCKFEKVDVKPLDRRVGKEKCATAKKNFNFMTKLPVAPSVAGMSQHKKVLHTPVSHSIPAISSFTSILASRHLVVHVGTKKKRNLI